MSNCENPFIIDLSQPLGHSEVRGEQFQELTQEATIAELLESIGAECLEIRF